MSKVEELKAQLFQENEGSDPGCILWAPIKRATVDSLIAAARAEGAAEERERILKSTELVPQFEKGTIEYGTWMVPKSLLAPATKEAPNYYAVGDKGETGESHS